MATTNVNELIDFEEPSQMRSLADRVRLETLGSVIYHQMRERRLRSGMRALLFDSVVFLFAFLVGAMVLRGDIAAAGALGALAAIVLRRRLARRTRIHGDLQRAYRTLFAMVGEGTSPAVVSEASESFVDPNPNGIFRSGSRP